MGHHQNCDHHRLRIVVIRLGGRMSRYFNATNARRLLDAYGGYETRRKVEFENNVTSLPTLPAPINNNGGPVEFEAERLRPSRAPSIEADVLVPAGWAGGLGIIVFGVTVYLAIINGYQWHLGCVVSLAVMGLTFLIGIFGLQKTLWMVERISHLDLDGDHVIGQPTVELHTNVHDESDRVRRQYIMDIGVTPEKLRDFCQGVLGGRGLVVNAWTGKNNLFSRSEYDRLMAELERAGMIERDGPGANAARKLTQAGREAFEQLANEQI